MPSAGLATPERWSSGQRHVHQQFVELAEDAWDGTPPSADDYTYWYSATDQVVVSRNKALLHSGALAKGAVEIADLPGLPTFTDAHHNLVRILK